MDFPAAQSWLANSPISPIHKRTTSASFPPIFLPNQTAPPTFGPRVNPFPVMDENNGELDDGVIAVIGEGILCLERSRTLTS
jgi:hypothetical protein